MTLTDRQLRRAAPRSDQSLDLARATVSVIARSGLRGLTIAAVAVEAGTDEEVLRSFGSTDALVDVALRYALDKSASIFADITPRSSLDNFVEHLTDLVARDPDLQVFQYELMLESRRTPRLDPHVKLLYATYLEATSQALTRLGITADEDLTLLVYSAIEGFIMHQLVAKDRLATERAIERLRRILSTTR
ncbi:TetR/AcrR family transcriptional regulator [Rhodococcus sp. IEGM 1409]|uniref:TetR/AcrR family transcriptional regulator n=1 Tax=Rhodococcus sp. IEGM 1409 TaxID=3047082 RepID=UPI0024B84FCF|nr:TetR family transcriptional regulator C-terminal domain-containing protein [Rhodococcus sp. IEGM 1409]MDI9903306.1 TetR/AcrR family transcriptional regulator [Rhodococcus sp. IEGM 1409]